MNVEMAAAIYFHIPTFSYFHIGCSFGGAKILKRTDVSIIGNAGAAKIHQLPAGGYKCLVLNDQLRKNYMHSLISCINRCAMLLAVVSKLLSA